MTDNILKKQVERTAKELVGRTVTLGLDFSDLGKPFGGEGMEGMAKVWDGSRHCTAYGHDFISVSVVGPDSAFEDETEMRRLANLCSLIGEERIRNITGCPRKPPEKEPGQLEFAFPDVV